jgi:tetratricopeptide (TPR) repeat protein
MSERRVHAISITCLAIVLALATILVPARARAQSVPAPPSGKPTAADEATAKRSFESGLKLYGEGAHAEALIAFEQSYRLGGRPSALKNIAQCHRNLKHFVEAHEAYEQMLALHEAQLSSTDKAAVKQALEELSILTGTLLVDVSEADAEIELDGKAIGRAPMTKPKRVAVAGHQLRVTKAGFAPFTQSVNVGSQDAKKVDVKLEVEKTTGHLVIREPSGRDVHVFLDGRDEGPAPWEGDVSAGEHVVETKGPKFASEPRKVRVAAKERLDLAIEAGALLGRLRVSTSPATATIAIDGREVGSGAWEGELPEGAHRVEVTVAGVAPQVREVSVGRGQLVVQEIPVVAAMAGGRITDYRGVYVRLSIMSAHPLSGSTSNEVPGQTQQTGGITIGAAAALRGGYSFGWLGVEAVGVAMLEHREEQLQVVTNSETFRDQSTSLQGFFGVGPRATSKDDAVRFTFGVAPGLSFKRYPAERKNENPGNSGGVSGKSGPSFVPITTSDSGNSKFDAVSYTAFGFVADAGILIGSTPGPKFFVGVHGWIDFPPQDLAVGPDRRASLPDEAYKKPGRGISVIESVQLFVGPTLGIQFGH